MEETVAFSALKKKQYLIKKILGRGATSVVYLVEDQRNGQLYACKVSDRKEWITPEAELMQRITHPLFPQRRDAWCDEEAAYLVMEYINGETMRSLLDAGKQFCIEECLQITLALADGLGYLHDLKEPVIYRDLKPDNILLEPNGKIRLIDLGAAAAPKGWRIGTPGYAAPEQRIMEEDRGSTSEPGPATDVFALGVLLRQLVQGRETASALLEIAERCTEVLPGKRIPGMHELRRELSRYDMSPGMRRKGRRKAGGPYYSKNIWMSHYKSES